MGVLNVLFDCVLIAVYFALCSGHAGHGHGGGHPAPPSGTAAPPPTDFHDPKITQDEAHLKEHLQDEIGKSDKPMTPQEMEFHYFRLHDTNNDTRLDGLEILSALSHMDTFPEIPPHETQGKSPDEIEEMKKKRAHAALMYYTDIIDRVLANDDLNKDGYLTYTEFAVARRRDEARYHQQAMEQQQMQQQQMAMQQQQMQMQQFQEWQRYQQFQAQQQQLQQKEGKDGNKGATQQFQQPPQQIQNQQQPTPQQFQQPPQQQLKSI